MAQARNGARLTEYTPLSQLQTASEFSAYLEKNDIDLPFEHIVETGQDAPLAQPVSVGEFEIGNRWAILPLEGWDSDAEGNPTEASLARWEAFGRSGVKTIWGESAAVRPDGRSTPTQLLASEKTVSGLTELVEAARSAHAARFDGAVDLKVGIQITHSGRLSHPAPAGDAAPVTARHHPYLDERLGPAPLLTDDELWRLIDDYASAADAVARAGFDFVDLKACHGYLSHELLGGYERPGEFGGSFENRTRFLRTITQRIKTDTPDLELALRLSAFDTVVHTAGPDQTGVPITDGPYRFWFGTDETGHEIDLTEPIRLLTDLHGMGVDLICVTGSSPYNSWHYQRPALNAKPGEYSTPEEPLRGVARHIQVTSALRAAVPGIVTVGSGYSYLQQWLPNVAQAAVRGGMTDIVGIARMHLAYPGMVSDSLAGRPLDLAAIQRAF